MKRTLAVILALTMLTGLLSGASIVGNAAGLTGWVTDPGTGLVYYYDANGVMNTESRITVDGKVCNFYPANSVVDGVDVSYSYLLGWKKMPSKITRYYGEGEYFFKTGFQSVGDKKYFFDKTSGALYIPKNTVQGMGWYKSSGAWYALSPVTGEWIVGLYTDASGNTYYYKKYDAKQGYTTGLVDVDGETYYFDPADGKMVKGTTVDFGDHQLTFGADGSLTKAVGVYNGYCYDENGDLCDGGVLVEAGGELYRTTTGGKLDDNYWYRTDPRDRFKNIYLYKGKVLEGTVTIDYGTWSYNSKMKFAESGTYYFAGNTLTPSTGFITTENGLEYYFSASTGKRYETADYAYANKTYYNFYKKGTIIDGVDYSYVHKVGLVTENGVLHYYEDGTRGYLKSTTRAVGGVTYVIDANGVAGQEVPHVNDTQIFTAESDNIGKWSVVFGNGTLTVSDDAKQGSYSGLITNRAGNWTTAVDSSTSFLGSVQADADAVRLWVKCDLPGSRLDLKIMPGTGGWHIVQTTLDSTYGSWKQLVLPLSAFKTTDGNQSLSVGGVMSGVWQVEIAFNVTDISVDHHLYIDGFEFFARERAQDVPGVTMFSAEKDGAPQWTATFGTGTSYERSEDAAQGLYSGKMTHKEGNWTTAIDSVSNLMGSVTANANALRLWLKTDGGDALVDIKIMPGIGGWYTKRLKLNVGYSEWKQIVIPLDEFVSGTKTLTTGAAMSGVWQCEFVFNSVNTVQDYHLYFDNMEFICTTPKVSMETLANAPAWSQDRFYLSTFCAAGQCQSLDTYRRSLQANKDAGINLIENAILSTRDLEACMDLCEELELDFLAQDISRFSGMSTHTLTPSLQAVTDVVSEYRHYRHLKGYFLWDEPYSEDFSTLAQWKNLFRTVDPGKLMYSLVLPSYGTYAWDPSSVEDSVYKTYVDNYIAQCDPDVLSVDYYPFRNGSESLMQNDLWRDLGYLRYRAVGTNKPLWFYFQAVPMGSGPQLTDTQVQVQMYAALTYGVKGLSYYTSNGFITDGSGNRTSRFEFAKALNNRVNNIGALLFNKTSTGIYHTGLSQSLVSAYSLDSTGSAACPFTTAVSGLVVGTFTGTDGTYLMITNKNYNSAATGTLNLKRTWSVSRYQPDSDTFAAASSTNQLQLSIPAGDCVVYRLAG